MDISSPGHTLLCLLPSLSETKRNVKQVNVKEERNTKEKRKIRLGGRIGKEREEKKTLTDRVRKDGSRTYTTSLLYEVNIVATLTISL